MARKPHTTDVIDADDNTFDKDKFADALTKMRADETATALVLAQQSEHISTLARELNYQGSTDLAVLENSARDSIRRIGMGIFELGGYLLLLKDGCAQGEFTPILERLGLAPRAAQHYMAITRRFANASTSTHLEKLGFSKMAELLPLDDDQVDDLVEEGQTGELALDDVGRMSVKELRAAVRRERADSAKHKGIADRQAVINAELHEEARLIKSSPPADQIKRLLSEAAAIQAETMGQVRGVFRNAILQLNGCGEDQRLLMGGMVGHLIAELTELRDEFSLPEISAKPEWERWAEDQAKAKATPIN